MLTLCWFDLAAAGAMLAAGAIAIGVLPWRERQRVETRLAARAVRAFVVRR